MMARCLGCIRYVGDVLRRPHLWMLGRLLMLQLKRLPLRHLWVRGGGVWKGLDGRLDRWRSSDRAQIGFNIYLDILLDRF